MKPLVTLTFDNGPWPGVTDRVLDILRDRFSTGSGIGTGSFGRLATAASSITVCSDDTRSIISEMAVTRVPLELSTPRLG